MQQKPLGVCSFHWNSQPRKMTFPKALVAVGNRAGREEVLPPSWAWRSASSLWALSVTTTWPLVLSESEVAQSCPTLCNPMEGSLPGSAVYGIFQTRILEWAAISFSRVLSQPRDQTWVSCIADRRFTIWATREASTSNSQSLRCC